MYIIFTSTVLLAVSMLLCVRLPNSAPLCGTAPRHPNMTVRLDQWDRQIRATYTKAGNNETVFWDTYESGPVVTMHPIDNALSIVDMGGTTVAEIDPKNDWQRLKMYSYQVPYVARSVFNANVSHFKDLSSVGTGTLQGVAKAVENGYIKRYYGNERRGVTSQDAYANYTYWSSVAFKAPDWFEIPPSWKHKVAHSILSAWSATPGVSVESAIILRTATEPFRLKIHFDSYDNFLYQVEGERRVLLTMPDMGHTVYPELDAREDACKRTACHRTWSYGGTVDLRNVNYTRHPLARYARMVPVTLHPGDALYIPAGWWHYIESQSTRSTCINTFIEPLNTKSANGNELRIAHPCDPDQWTLLQRWKYAVIEALVFLQKTTYFQILALIYETS